MSVLNMYCSTFPLKLYLTILAVEVAVIIALFLCYGVAVFMLNFRTFSEY